MQRLEIPPDYNRNDPRITAQGVEETGAYLIRLATERMGLDSLAGKNILDVGCGTRFTQTIINRAIPIGSYTGVDVEPQLIRWLSENANDARFRFVHWPVYNAMYNPQSSRRLRDTPLPVARSFDIIWLFSVFTHLEPDDADALLGQLRSVVREDGALFFSAFIDDALAGFRDAVPDQPLLNAYYGRNYMRTLIERNGWKIVSSHPPEAGEIPLIRHHFVCRPKGGRAMEFHSPDRV